MNDVREANLSKIDTKCEGAPVDLKYETIVNDLVMQVAGTCTLYNEDITQPVGDKGANLPGFVVAHYSTISFANIKLKTFQTS